MSISFNPGLPQTSAAPSTEAKPRSTEVHGVALEDPYGWLRADNWREVLQDPDTLPDPIRRVLERENAFSADVLSSTTVLQKRLVAEMRGRIEDESADVPVPEGPFEYYGRYREGGQHELVCRTPRGGGPEAILLDGDALAKGRAFFELGSAEQSPDHALLAFSADTKGSELYTIGVRRLADGSDLPDRVPRTDGEIVWTADGTGFFYVRLDHNHRASSVHLHRLGTKPAADAPIYRELDPTWFVSIHQSLSGRFLIISIHGHDAAEVHVIDLDEPGSPPRIVEPRQAGIRYEVEHHGERFIILTNLDAEDFRIVEAPLDRPGRAAWRDLVPHQAGRMIVGMVPFADHLVRLEREDSLPRIVIREMGSGQERSIAFPEDAYALGLEDLAEQTSPVMRFSYSSMTTPEEVYDFDLRSGERVLRKRQVIPSGHDPARYVTRRIFATAPDGASVPVSVLHRRDLVLDGPALVARYPGLEHWRPRLGPLPALRVRRVRLHTPGRVQHACPVAGGSRLRLCHRPCPGRHRQGLALVRGRQARA